MSPRKKLTNAEARAASPNEPPIFHDPLDAGFDFSGKRHKIPRALAQAPREAGFRVDPERVEGESTE